MELFASLQSILFGLDLYLLYGLFFLFAHLHAKYLFKYYITSELRAKVTTKEQ